MRQPTLFFVLLVVFFFGCGDSSEQAANKRPESREAFRNAFATAYASGDNASIYALIDLEGSSSKFVAILKRLTTAHSGEHRIQSIDFLPYRSEGNPPIEVNGKTVVPTIEPVFWFVCNTVDATSNKRGQIRTAVGRDSQGNLAFCGMKYQ